MKNYKVSDTSLEAVANAIRTKGSTSAELVFPDGFVTAIGNIPTGGGSTLITKNITANGTYNASSDSADGYSSVTVALPIIKGTFTGTTAGAAMDVNIPYTGSGYPIAFMIYPTGGSYNSNTTYYNAIQQSAVNSIYGVKGNVGIAPDYTTTNVDENIYSVASIYKSTNSSATSYADTMIMTAKSAGDYAASSSSTVCARFNSSNKLSVYISNGSNTGFMKDIEYTYQILYSA